jgi:inositol hexakisphosphate/diphosphoinositol-pentakisphosphate kinase
MEKKARSKPMMQIMRRFDPSVIEFKVFGDDVLLNQPVEQWPVVDYLIAWYSTGYPLTKAEEYVKLRKPHVINDVSMQHQLMDRRRVYSILKEAGINTPRHVVLNEEDRTTHPGCIRESDDWVEIHGVRFNKPVVEKPVNAEDHNIYIYYPLSAGGGSKRLFRKVGNKASEFYENENELRTEGSYIYEEFIETQGVDVKVCVCVGVVLNLILLTFLVVVVSVPTLLSSVFSSVSFTRIEPEYSSLHFCHSLLLLLLLFLSITI